LAGSLRSSLLGPTVGKGYGVFFRFDSTDLCCLVDGYHLRRDNCWGSAVGGGNDVTLLVGFEALRVMRGGEMVACE
jgi:hypothetical protein